MKIFLQGEVLSAVDLNANFRELSTAEMDPRYYGGVFLTGWTQYQAGNSQSISYYTIDDAPIGNTVIQVNSHVHVRGPYIPLDTTLDYTVEFWARKVATGTSSTSNLQFVVTEFDTNLSPIPGDGVDWYYPSDTQQSTLTLNTWAKYGPYSIGPNSDKNHHANGKFISVGFNANHANGNDVIQLTGFRISPYSTGGGGGGGGTPGPRGYIGSVGQTGSYGYTGSAGQVIYTGSIGYSGSAGIGGYTGSAGYNGYDGSVGYTGSRGFVGSRGVTGFTGSIGGLGYTGSIGIGYTGSSGIDGFQGSEGFQGSKGDIGYTGSAGYIGMDGYTGSRGFIGSTGYIGSKGTTAINGYGSNGQVLVSNGTFAEFKYKFYTGDYNIIPLFPEYGDVWLSTIDNKPFMWVNNGDFDTWYDFLPPSN